MLYWFISELSETILAEGRLFNVPHFELTG